MAELGGVISSLCEIASGAVIVAAIAAASAEVFKRINNSSIGRYTHQPNTADVLRVPRPADFEYFASLANDNKRENVGLALNSTH